MRRMNGLPVWRNGRGAVLVLLALVLAWPLVAWSHAHPDTRIPDKNAVLQQAPDKVEITFTSELEPAFSRIKVTDAEGQPVNQGQSRVDKQNPRQLVAPVQQLQPGTYTVAWHVVSRDGHTTQGQYTFTVKGAH